MLKDALEDGAKMQKLAVVVDDKGYKKSADTIDSFRSDLWNYKSFPRSHWRRIRTTNRPGENQQGSETKESHIRGIPKRPISSKSGGLHHDEYQRGLDNW
jgi:hypothetical protein